MAAILPEARDVLLFRAQNAAAIAGDARVLDTKVCSAGCGRDFRRSAFSKKQWSARAVRRCLDCVQAGGEPKICAHGKGAFDCAACAKIVKQEDEYEKYRALEAENAPRESARVKFACKHVYIGTKRVRDVVVTIAPEEVTLEFKGSGGRLQTYKWSVPAHCIGELRWYHDDALGLGVYDFFAMTLSENVELHVDVAENPNFCGFDPTDERRRCVVCVLEGEAVARFKEDAVDVMYGGIGHSKGWHEPLLGPVKAMSRVLDFLKGAFRADAEFCANCGTQSPPTLCGCKLKAYCSTACQRFDWRNHRALCTKSRAAAADEEENVSPADADQRKTVEESPVFPELKAAIAECANLSLKAAFPDPIRCVPAQVLVESEENMLAAIKEAGLDRPAGGAANLLRRFREALEKDNVGNQRALAEQQAGKIESLVTSIADANPGIAVRDHVKKMIADATQEENRKRRQGKRIKRRKCQVCPRAESITAPRFLVCAGCKKRRYCSTECQEKDWLEYGHKRTCAVISDFDCGAPGCPMSERGYCDWCAETFCMDCEGDQNLIYIDPCANCGRFSCGSLQEHSYGPGGPCPVVIYCDTCGGGYCGECREEHDDFEVHTCDACETSHCETCREMGFCSVCQYDYCRGCRAVESCADCDMTFCTDCRSVRKCINCDKMVCTKCSHGKEENDIMRTCRDCERLLAARVAELEAEPPNSRRGRLRDADKRVFSRIKEIGIWASAGGTGPRPPSPDSEDLDYTGHGAMVAELIATAEEQALKLRKEAEGLEGKHEP